MHREAEVVIHSPSMRVVDLRMTLNSKVGGTVTVGTAGATVGSRVLEAAVPAALEMPLSVTAGDTVLDLAFDPAGGDSDELELRSLSLSE
jgi:hypothetical protein